MDADECRIAEIFQFMGMTQIQSLKALLLNKNMLIQLTNKSKDIDLAYDIHIDTIAIWNKHNNAKYKRTLPILL